jgi:predicted AlkP superfamily pyrophosphatase or phosphodiesterase
MKSTSEKLLVVQVAGLGYDFLCAHHGDAWEGLQFRPASTVFPAVTCAVQASFRTALSPSSHGMVGNGLWDASHVRPRFWEQSAALVEGPRIWDAWREEGRSVALLFWQQSLGESVDCVVSPAPIHKHHGGMIQDCYSLPEGLYGDICSRVGSHFNLAHYWGPQASHRSSAWIAEATAALLADPRRAPDLCLTYLPALDYDLQRYGLNHARSRAALTCVMEQLGKLKACADANGYGFLVFGDYAIADVTGSAVCPNRVLREAGLMRTRRVGRMHYPDFYTSPAFAVVDHEIAHVYLNADADVDRVASVLAATPGVAEVLDQVAQSQMGFAHRNAGRLLLIAEEGCWFAYPWWRRSEEAPDYAGHVDIHSKPGYDPCELFWGWPPGSVSGNTARVRGTHGRVGSGREIAWASTCDIDAATLLELADSVGRWRL